MNPLAVKAAAATAVRHRRHLLPLAAAVAALPLLLLFAGGAMLGALISGAAQDSTTSTGAVCSTATGGSGAGVTAAGLDPRQTGHAATIAGVAAQKVPGPLLPRAQAVAFVTAMQEARLLNLASRAVPASIGFPHDDVAAGDHDSVGLFQQRAGWGSVQTRMTPAASAGLFFDALLAVPGWDAMPLWQAAQTVQRSAFPTAYRQWETLAADLVAAVGGATAAPACPMPATCAAGGDPAEAGLTPDGLLVLRCVAARFPGAGLTFGGNRSTNVSVGGDHATGRAVDVMIPNYLTPAGRTLGSEVAEWVRTNAAALGVNYVIFADRIWSVQRTGEGWRPYAARDASDNERHLNHVHVSVIGDAGTGMGGAWTLPLPPGSYTLTGRFGQCGSRWAACHTGLDMAAPAGTPIVAAASGRLLSCGAGGPYGAHLVKLDHGGDVQTWYAHGSSCPPGVPPGGPVTAGQRIGTVASEGNSTGPHLHLEVRQGGVPVDPAPWLAEHGVNP